MNERGVTNVRVVVAVVLALALVVLIGVYFFSSSPPAAIVTTTTPVTTPVVTHPTTPTTAAPPTQILPSQAGYPAYQHIPYSGNGITVSLVNVAADGRLILEVFSQTLTVAQEKAVYRAFLQSYGDTGAKYLPEFASTLHTPAP